MADLRAGLIGLGMMGRHHARVLASLPGVELVGIADPTGGVPGAAPHGVPVYNPAFDVTPHRYLTGIVTEEGICYPPFDVSLRRAKEAAEARIRNA